MYHFFFLSFQHRHGRASSVAYFEPGYNMCNASARIISAPSARFSRRGAADSRSLTRIYRPVPLAYCRTFLPDHATRIGWLIPILCCAQQQRKTNISSSVGLFRNLRKYPSSKVRASLINALFSSPVHPA